MFLHALVPSRLACPEGQHRLHVFLECVFYRSVSGQKIERVDLDDDSQKAVDKWQVFTPIRVPLAGEERGEGMTLKSMVK